MQSIIIKLNVIIFNYRLDQLYVYNILYYEKIRLEIKKQFNNYY